jgi:thiopeptide-type bacteriocin biosynthesis protein
MPTRPLFTTAAQALLRMPILPRARAEATWTALDVRTASSPDLTRYILDLVADPVLREAVEVSSDSLATTLARLESGEELSRDRLVRAASAVTRYVLRAATRPTPFGELAGVALARIDGSATAKVVLGSRPVKSVRPDMGWLLGLADELERDPAVLRTLRVAANPLCAVRGDRVVLACVAGGDDGTPSAEVSIRRTPAVEAAFDIARSPVAFADLVSGVAGGFPDAPRARVETALRQLVEKGMLLTELVPGLDDPDPLEHVLHLVERVPELPAAIGLRTVREAVDSYARRPPGGGRECWANLRRTARALRQATSPVQVDLRHDVDVVLPSAIADDLDLAARALARMSPDTAPPAHLAAYHEDFLARYAPGRLVPVTELLDPQRGLGAPATYLLPRSDRKQRRTAPAPHGDRDQLLLALAQESARDQRREVVIDDAAVELLAHPGPGGDADRSGEPDPPVSVEIFAELFADSPEALARLDYRLFISTASAPRVAGSTLGRFARMLDDGRWLAELASTTQRAAPHHRYAAVRCRPVKQRIGNVAQVPAVWDHRIPLDVLDEHDEHAIALRDILVGADEHRMWLCSATTGERIVPVITDMLNDQIGRSNTARFLREMGLAWQGAWSAWDWGPAVRLPYLPRVRHGRTVLHRALWNPGPDLTRQGDERDWHDRFERWRRAWEIPRVVQLVADNNRIELNLDVPLHRRLLRREWRRRPNSWLEEPDCGTGPGTGWLDGHRAELVFWLFSRSRSTSRSGTANATGHPPTEEPAVRSDAVARRARPAAVRAHLPGGRWLYAKLYAGRPVHDELLADHLPRLLRDMPDGIDRWFFIRYADPEPHLRLRFHGDQRMPADAPGILQEWAEGLLASGMAGDLVIDAYRPELERYGGPEAIEDAERAFCADSLAALAQLRALRAGTLDLDTSLLAAANYVDVLRGLGEDGWAAWLGATYPKGPADKAFRTLRRTALDVVDATGDWQGLAALPGGDRVLAAWAARRPAIEAYGRRLRELQAVDRCWSDRTAITSGVLHMLHNRLVGIDRDAERASYAIARGAVRAQLDRARFCS